MLECVLGDVGTGRARHHHYPAARSNMTEPAPMIFVFDPLLLDESVGVEGQLVLDEEIVELLADLVIEDVLGEGSEA